jgi:flagellar assembly factor FliW
MSTESKDPILSFPAGLVGFPELKTFRFFEPADGYPFKFLQNVEKPEISFVCLDPLGFKPDYNVPLSEEDALALAIEKPEEALIMTIVVIPEDPKKMTTNLAGPLVINTKTLQGRQIVLNADQYPLQFPVLGG